MPVDVDEMLADAIPQLELLFRAKCREDVGQSSVGQGEPFAGAAVGQDFHQAGQVGKSRAFLDGIGMLAEDVGEVKQRILNGVEGRIRGVVGGVQEGKGAVRIMGEEVEQDIIPLGGFLQHIHPFLRLRMDMFLLRHQANPHLLGQLDGFCIKRDQLPPRRRGILILALGVFEQLQFGQTRVPLRGICARQSSLGDELDQSVLGGRDVGLSREGCVCSQCCLSHRLNRRGSRGWRGWGGWRGIRRFLSCIPPRRGIFSFILPRRAIFSFIPPLLAVDCDARTMMRRGSPWLGREW